VTVLLATLSHSAYFAVVRFFVAAALSYPPANSYCYCSSCHARLTTCVVDYCRPVVAVASVPIDGVAAEPFAIGFALIVDPFPRSLDIR